MYFFTYFILMQWYKFLIPLSSLFLFFLVSLFKWRFTFFSIHYVNSKHALGTWDGVNAMYVFVSYHPFDLQFWFSEVEGDVGFWYSPATRWPHGKFHDGTRFQSFSSEFDALRFNDNYLLPTECQLSGKSNGYLRLSFTHHIPQEFKRKIV